MPNSVYILVHDRIIHQLHTGFHLLGILLAHTNFLLNRIPVAETAVPDVAIANSIDVALAAVVLLFVLVLLIFVLLVLICHLIVSASLILVLAGSLTWYAGLVRSGGLSLRRRSLVRGRILLALRLGSGH